MSKETKLPKKIPQSEYDKPGWFAKAYGDKSTKLSSWYNTPPASPPLVPYVSHTVNIMKEIKETKEETSQGSGR
jgi:hypothetical protein